MEQVFDERQRNIFRYWNGIAYVWGDPLQIYRRLLVAFGGDMGPTYANAASEDPAISLPALGELADKVRDAFGMVPFDQATGQGATESDCLDALADWSAHLGLKKKPPDSSPICSSPSELVSSSDALPCATPTGSVSG